MGVKCVANCGVEFAVAPATCPKCGVSQVKCPAITITPVKAAALLANPGEGIEEAMERVEKPVKPEIIVRTSELQLRTAKLTKSILKQIVEEDFQRVRIHLTDWANKVVGWVHGSVADKKYHHYLIIKKEEGEYVKVEVMESTAAKFKQIYVV